MKKIIFIYGLIILFLLFPYKNNAISEDDSVTNISSKNEFDVQIEPSTLLSLAPLVIDAIPGLDISDITSIFTSTQNIFPEFVGRLFGRKNQSDNNSAIIIKELGNINSRVNMLSDQIIEMDNSVNKLLDISELIFRNTMDILGRLSDSERNILNQFDEKLARGYRIQIRTTIDLIRFDTINSSKIWTERKQDFNTSLNYLYSYEINFSEMNELFGYTIFYLTMEDPNNLNREFSSPSKIFIRSGFNKFLERVSESYIKRDEQFNYSFGLFAQYLGIAGANGLLNGDRNLEFYDDGRAASLRAITRSSLMTFSNRNLFIPWKDGFEPGSKTNTEYISPRQWIYNVLSKPENLKNISISRDHYYTLLEAGKRYKLNLGL